MHRAPIHINLDNTVPIHYRNLRQGNSFTMHFDFSINGTPIMVNELAIRISINGLQRLIVEDAELLKSGSVATITWPSFPLPVGNYKFDVTWVRSGKTETIIPGTIEIIRKDA